MPVQFDFSRKMMLHQVVIYFLKRGMIATCDFFQNYYWDKDSIEVVTIDGMVYINADFVERHLTIGNSKSFWIDILSEVEIY
jgi:hypothetical protein